MILPEIIDGRIRRYSDQGLKILQVETGRVYEDAVDVIPCPYSYDETDEPIPDYDIEPQEALEILMGGTA